MSIFEMFVAIVLGGAASWFIGYRRAAGFARVAGQVQAGSLPGQHATLLTICTTLPAIVFAAIWPTFSGKLVLHALLANPAAARLPASPMERDAILAEARGLTDGSLEFAFNPVAEHLARPLADATAHYAQLGGAMAIALMALGFGLGFLQLKPQARARQKVEWAVMACLVVASLVSLITTFGIVASLIFESARFFQLVPIQDFLLGTHWEPVDRIEPGQTGGFGAVPLFWGTLFIGAVIAMVMAVPIGVMAAIFLTQYAPARMRAWLKPVLEILAGVPTVVYGYFAALTFGPIVRGWAISLGMADPASESALAAGLVMGVMIIPLISSMADDSLAAVPNAMRDGALAMGSTKSEAIRKVLVPAALPGIVGGVLLAVSRAIGETMIVVMAAGLAANLTINPFESVTTVTTQIVQLLTGDQEFDSAKTLSAFALGLVLFAMTLFLNIIALMIVKRYREAYE